MIKLKVGLLIVAASVGLVAIVLSFALLGTKSEVGWGLIGVVLGGIIATGSQWLIAASDREHQLRTAALDRRLDAHQEAYALWKKLIMHAHKKEEIGAVVLECQDWWYSYCLFLAPEARQAFYLAYQAAHNHSSLTGAHSNPDLVKQNWKEITGAGEVLERAVALPSIGNAKEPIGASPPSAA